MKEVTLTIDGKNVSCPPGTSILNAALENGIRIPTLCHHPHLEAVGACRLCLVEDEKSGRMLASCVTPVAPDMAVLTDTPDIKKHRVNIIRLMMANHPESCIVCSQGNRCELRRVASELGVGLIDLYPMPHYAGLEEANPFIIRDLSKCIVCGKCIRADHELVVVGAIDYNLRGFKSRPATVHEMPLERSSCTFCGTCVSLCPTGALSIRKTGYISSPRKNSTTICGFCGVGCSLVMGSTGDQIVEVNPSHDENTVNRSTLCVRGHFAHDYLNVSERLAEPLIRSDGELRPAAWQEALDVVAQGFLAVRKKYGPQSIGFLGSSKCSVEENYIFQKIARVLLGTNNIDNGCYVSGRSVIARFSERLDGGERRKPLAGLEEAETIFVIGADPTETAPVAGYYIKRASRIKRIPLIVADPRRTGLDPFSSLRLPVLPGTDVVLINALTALLVKKDAVDFSFVEKFTQGFGGFCESLSTFDLETACGFTGLDMPSMERAAGLLQGKKIAFVIGHGILQQENGPSTMDALINLALVTGSLAGDNRGFTFLLRENNEAGALDMGTVPDFLPGRRPFHNNVERKYWEKAWGIKLSPDPGLHLIRMLEEAERGTLKALYVMGENPLQSLPDTERVRKALENLEHLVVQDILSTETARMAHAVLPGAAFSEKGGHFTNMEGRIQSFGPVVSPPGKAKPDWEILSLVSTKMGDPEEYHSLRKISTEISRKIPLYSEMGKGGEDAWVREDGRLMDLSRDGTGEPILFSEVIPPGESPLDKEYAFTAVFGSLKYHLGCGTRTGFSKRIKDFDFKGEVEISPEDCSKLDLKAKDRVRISSRHGSIERELSPNRGLKQGCLFIPIGFYNNDVRHLLAWRSRKGAVSPGWNTCRVRVEKLSKSV